MATTNRNFKVKNGLDASGDISTTGAVTAAGNLRSTNSSGDEGGEIFLNAAATNTTLTGGVTIDVWQNRLRFFEQGGSARGFYIDISTGGNSVGTNLVGGGSASNSFATISTPSGTSPVADSSTDTLTLTAGTGITITGDSSADSIAIATNGTASNTNSTLVLRDGSGNFAANQATLVSQKFGTGTGAPSFNSYSGGVRTILYDNISPTSAGYAVGINSGEFWHTLSDTTGSYKWYGGVTLAATLTGTGALTTVGTITAPLFSGSGASLTSLNGSNISSGTVADARIASALTGKTYNGLTVTTTTGTLTVASGKTLTASNSLTLAGTDGRTMTFPSTNATIARTDAAQTFTGTQTMTSPSIITSITTGTTGTFDLISSPISTVNFAGGTAILNIGAANISKTINLGTGATNATTINIGTSATSSSTINLQGPFINVGRATSSSSSITGVDTFITGAATSTSGASATVVGGSLKISGGAANQEDEFNTASVRAGDVYIDGGSISTISGVQTKGRVYVGTQTDTGSITIGRTGISTTLPGSLSADSATIGGGFGSTGVTISSSGNIDSDGALTVGGGYGASGVTISSVGAISANSNIVVDGNGTFGNLVGTGTRNVNSTSAGILTNATSSARYKQDIVNAEYVYEDILKLQPKTFKLKSEVEESESPITYGGFIAEDVDEIDSLKVFVGYARTPEGQLIPDSLYYAEMVSALVSAIKHQDTIIKSLQTRIEALEN